MYEFWFNYIKPQYGEKAKLCHMDIIYIKTEDMYIDISKDIATRLNTSNYELERPLPCEKI